MSALWAGRSEGQNVRVRQGFGESGSGIVRQLWPWVLVVPGVGRLGRQGRR